MLSDWLRGIGGALELFAVALVVWEVRRVQRDLPPGPPGLPQRLWNWIRGKKPAGQTVPVGKNLELEWAGEIIPRKWSEKWSAEQKIDELLDRLEDLRVRTKVADRQLEHQIGRLRKDVDTQVHDLRSTLRELTAQRDEATRRETRFRGYGVLPLMLGIALTTWPDEIADLLQRLF